MQNLKTSMIRMDFHSSCSRLNYFKYFWYITLSNCKKFTGGRSISTFLIRKQKFQICLYFHGRSEARGRGGDPPRKVVLTPLLPRGKLKCHKREKRGKFCHILSSWGRLRELDYFFVDLTNLNFSCPKEWVAFCVSFHSIRSYFLNALKFCLCL